MNAYAVTTGWTEMITWISSGLKVAFYNRNNRVRVTKAPCHLAANKGLDARLPFVLEVRGPKTWSIESIDEYRDSSLYAAGSLR
jgi:hypothetical protein